MDHPASSGASGQRVARSRARRSASSSGAVCGVNRRGMAAPYDPHDHPETTIIIVPGCGRRPVERRQWQTTAAAGADRIAQFDPDFVPA